MDLCGHPKPKQWTFSCLVYFRTREVDPTISRAARITRSRPWAKFPVRLHHPYDFHSLFFLHGKVRCIFLAHRAGVETPQSKLRLNASSSLLAELQTGEVGFAGSTARVVDPESAESLGEPEEGRCASGRSPRTPGPSCLFTRAPPIPYRSARAVLAVGRADLPNSRPQQSASNQQSLSLRSPRACGQASSSRSPETLGPHRLALARRPAPSQASHIAQTQYTCLDLLARHSTLDSE